MTDQPQPGIAPASDEPPAAGAPASPSATGIHDAGWTPAPKPALPPEEVGRGILFALAVVPVGVILWVIIWSAGFISALVAFAVSAGAAYLYRLGSRGRIAPPGSSRSP